MKRRTFLYGLTGAYAMALAGTGAWAAGFAEDVVNQLTRQGFHGITVETTLLGRVRINAMRDDGTREIILNPRTGEILRDTWQAAGVGRATPIIDDIDAKTANNDDASDSGNSGDDSSGSGSGSSGSDDSGSGSSGSDDSGSGSSGSGSGSGGSGSDDGGGGSSGSGSSGGGSDDKSDDDKSDDDKKDDDKKDDDKKDDDKKDDDKNDDKGGKRGKGN